MSSLHLIRASAFSSGVLANALPVIKANDQVVLFDDGVYNLNHPALNKLLALIGNEKLFVIEHHYLARGLVTETTANFITMAEFVSLTEATNQIITWQ